MKKLHWIRTLALLMMFALLVPMFAMAESAEEVELEEVAEVIEQEEAVEELEIELPYDEIDEAPTDEDNSGWSMVGSERVYILADGSRATGWLQLDTHWYYFSSEGYQQSGWIKIGKVWYYLDPEVMDGQMVTGWKKIGSKWYYFNGSGAMQTGWKKISGKWYYLESSGAMATGWKKTDGVWYYLDSSGAMVTGWQQIGSKWYYFETNGAMLCNTTRTIGGVSYTFGSDGASSRAPSGGNTKYRALLIGQESFSPTCTRNSGDVTLMANMLNHCKGPTGGTYTITKKYNLNASQTLSAIGSAFSGATSSDVSLFFIATHGDSSSTGSYAGALAMLPSGSLQLSTLANKLKSVPGKVIVILESCGSGAAVYNTNNGEFESKIAFNEAKAFSDAAIKAFSKADCGILVDDEGNGVAENTLATNTGEFRVSNKFYVLTASQYRQNSVGSEYYHYNYFTKWLTDGIGTSGTMKADQNYAGNKDGYTTLHELYKYIAGVGNNYVFHFSDGSTATQQVAVYPSNSSYKLFKR